MTRPILIIEDDADIAERHAEPLVDVLRRAGDRIGVGKGREQLVVLAEAEIVGDREGYDVRYREFDGTHIVPYSVAREALDWFTSG